MTFLASVNRRRWVRAMVRLGLQVDKKKGKGSHYRVIHPTTHAVTTLPYVCHPLINQAIYKQLMSWGFTKSAIDTALKKV